MIGPWIAEISGIKGILLRLPRLLYRMSHIASMYVTRAPHVSAAFRATNKDVPMVSAQDRHLIMFLFPPSIHDPGSFARS